MSTGFWTGKALGKYEIGDLVGQGGMAEVYKSRHSALNRDVAVKLIHAHLASREGFVERFQREARLVAALRHPNIVQVFDLDSYIGVYYMVMEFIDGTTLAARLDDLRAQGRQMPLRQAINLIITLCSALDYAHSHSMIHRDLKPGNVMFTSQGQPILTDFGLAKIVGGMTQTSSSLVIGTPMYMSPEQGFGNPVDGRSDIYSLGVILYELVTGHPPFEGDTPLSIIMKHFNQPLPSARNINPHVPEAVERIIATATAKRPEERYQTCAEFSEALQTSQAFIEYQDEKIATPPARQTGSLSQTPPARRTPTPIHPLTPPPSQTPTPSSPTPSAQKTIALNSMANVFIQVLGPVGRIMDAKKIAAAMGENQELFPADRLDELLNRVAIHYRITDKEKIAQIGQMMQDLIKT